MKRLIYLAGLCGFLGSPLWAATINVPTGGDFQAALNKAVPGDTIVLEAGASYPTAGGFTLPNKGNSTQIITIQTSGLASLPASGYRIHPSDASHMARLVSTVNASPVLQTAAGAHHYSFLGIEFALAPGMWSYDMVKFGTGQETSLSQLPHDLLMDRCYVHGDPTAQPGTKRGIDLETGNVSILNSYVSEIHVVGQDNQAIASFNGSGPFHIINNYLEAATENVIFGGQDPTIPNLVPSNIEFRNNYLFKPMSWYTKDPNYAGIHWAVKNLFELKNAEHVIIDGNVMENNWQDGQTGFALLFTPRNQNNTAPWAKINDVTVTHNIIRHSGSGVQILSTDTPNPSGITSNLVFKDNLIDDINPDRFGSDGRMFQLVTPGAAAQNITLDHNTALHATTGNSFGTVGDCCTFADGFKFTNNIVKHGSYGFKGGGVGEGLSALNTYILNWTMTKNVIIAGGRPVDYPTGNYFPADVSSLGFNNGTAGDYLLTAASPYKSAGTDGKDIGADIPAINAATCGTMAGIPTSACSTYVPPPSSPVITSTKSASVTVGNPFSYQITATQSPTRFGATGLPAGLSVNTTSGLISGTPTATGTFPITLSASNGSTGTGTLTLTVNPNNGPVACTSLIVSKTSFYSGAPESNWLVNVTAPTSNCTWSASSDSAWIVLTTNPTPPAGNGTVGVRVLFNTGAFRTGHLSIGATTYLVQQEALPIPTPVITSTLTASAITGTAFSYSITASNSPTRFDATGLPMGLILDPVTGGISGTPISSGTFSVTLGATNAGGTGTAVLQITATLPIPVLQLSAGSFVFSNTTIGLTSPEVHLTVTNTGTSGASVTSFGVAGPFALSRNFCAATSSWNGVMAPGTHCDLYAVFQPTTASQNSGTLTLVSGGLSYSVALSGMGIALPPVITSTTTAVGQVGSPFTYTITATNNPTSYNVTGLPAGLTVNTANGAISGTPVNSGIFPVDLQVSNNGGTGSSSLTLTITARPTITPSPNQFSFGTTSIGSVSTEQNLTVSNSGTVGASVTSWTISGPFAISRNFCAATSLWNGVMAPGTHCNIYTVFNPTTGGPANGSLTLMVGGLPYTIALTGSGSAIPPAASAFAGVDFSTVRVFPNPWRSDRHAGHVLTFDGMPVNSTVKIFTLSGHKVASLSAPSGSVPWDLKNEDGDPVASGLYIYLITAGSNEKTTGKLVVIR
jgi:hypothetical protein